MTSARPERRTPTQVRARMSHDAVLEATRRLLEESTEGGLPSTNRIARRAGVSVGTLYQYFDNREAILRALVREHSQEMSALVVSHAGPLGLSAPRDVIPAFIDAMAAAHAVAPRLHLALVRETLSDPALLAEVQDPARALVNSWLELHRAVIRPQDLSAAAFLLTRSVEAAIHGQLFEDPARLGDTSWRRELCDLLVRYLLE